MSIIHNMPILFFNNEKVLLKSRKYLVLASLSVYKCIKRLHWRWSNWFIWNVRVTINEYLTCLDKIFYNVQTCTELIIYFLFLESYCGPCPKNWVCYRNNCYQFFNESKSWYQSQASCISQNSSLLKIYSREDQVEYLF